MSDPSVVFFLQEILAGWQKECLAEEGGLEILLSMNCRDKGSTRFTMDQISLTDQTCPSPDEEREEEVKTGKLMVSETK